MNLPPIPEATPKELRKFGWTVGGVFLVLTGFLVWRDHPILSTVTGVLSAYLLIFGTLAPTWLEAFHNKWWKGALFIGHYMGMVAFTIIYVVLFTPVSLIARVVGFDPLGLRTHRKAESYWHTREGALSSDHYEYQFARTEDKENAS
jgi:hypothetical protein